MPDKILVRPAQMITVDMVRSALNLVTYQQPDAVEACEPPCAWAKLCGEQGCRFPRYFRRGGPWGLTAHVLSTLGYPDAVLKELDTEYEVGEVLHPGVKIGRSRNAALARIDSPGVALLSYLQNNQKAGLSWAQIADRAFKPNWTIALLDARRRPWRY